MVRLVVIFLSFIFNNPHMDSDGKFMIALQNTNCTFKFESMYN